MQLPQSYTEDDPLLVRYPWISLPRPHLLAHICHPPSYPLVHQWLIFKKSPSGTTRRSFCENGAQWMNLRTPPGCRSMPSTWQIARCCPFGRVATLLRGGTLVRDETAAHRFHRAGEAVQAHHAPPQQQVGAAGECAAAAEVILAGGRFSLAAMQKIGIALCRGEDIQS